MLRYALAGAIALACLCCPALAESPMQFNINQADGTTQKASKSWHRSVNTGSQSISVRASWYGGGERLSAHTSTGERFNPNARTCAHRTLPFGTRVEVAYRGRKTVCRVNDRGPAAWTGREFDLSRAAASEIGLIAAGSGSVTIRILN